ncbi:unnamed protein product [Pleuronectes platessa]|uniref:Uncharacterized protein n=1 Tax=Pleuronectes platessa TaxID=8262 RepID=A0A9N7VC56_PLEPL|nr:unnamed protein product [Pleuronectes platessa]
MKTAPIPVRSPCKQPLSLARSAQHDAAAGGGGEEEEGGEGGSGRGRGTDPAGAPQPLTVTDKPAAKKAASGFSAPHSRSTPVGVTGPSPSRRLPPRSLHVPEVLEEEEKGGGGDEEERRGGGGGGRGK